MMMMTKKFSKQTKVHLKCNQCDIEETITLEDLPSSPKGFFIWPVAVQCIQCLNLIPFVVRGKDAEEEKGRDNKEEGGVYED